MLRREEVDPQNAVNHSAYVSSYEWPTRAI